MDFQEANRRYAELRRQYDAGTLDVTEFDKQREQLKVQDVDGRWWVKGRDRDQWYFYNGEAWVPGNPAILTSGSVSGTRNSGTPASGGSGWEWNMKTLFWIPVGIGLLIGLASMCSV